MMRKAAISLAFSMTLAGPALAQTNPVPIPAARPAPQAARPAIHPVSKSADPTFDEGTYQRISAAMLSYSSIEVRGGWPMLPAGAKLVVVAHYNNSASNRTVKSPAQPGGDMFMPVMQYSVAVGAGRSSDQQQ